MKHLTAGIVAHVDSGKTTLSEQLLYLAGELRRAGRVDHGDAFLDHDKMERERGITIFSKQAILHLPDLTVTLLDTPGHVDFSAEMERTLAVLDLAILVVSGSEGVQSHTETLWRLLSRYEVPTILFINKMDLAKGSAEVLLESLRKKLSDGCVSFSGERDDEEIASRDEDAIAEYLESERVGPETIRRLIAERKLFPCFFGSALKGDGVKELLTALPELSTEPAYGAEFGARVFKIGSDEAGNRLTFLKVTGGTIRTKQVVYTGEEEKIHEIRVISGLKYESVAEAPAGTVCAVTGLNGTFAGQGLGTETDGKEPLLRPVVAYQVLLPESVSPQEAYPKLCRLAEELPEVALEWDAETKEIRVRLMGQVQTEILQRMVKDRFSYVVNFGPGKIEYRETILSPVTGVGHFEPLRHYAEVHLLLTPAERGSGLQFETDCPTDVLKTNWQRLILTHLKERVHRGVLIGAPITDMKLTLTNGRAHLKHTEGGDFRQATYRAVRQGLKKAESILLEPYYEFRLTVPQELVGRAMTELTQKHATFSAPETEKDLAVLSGRGPVSTLFEYPKDLQAYTGGRGQIAFRFAGYDTCHNAEEIIEASGYDSEADLKNPTGSVFCAHGAGFQVPWDEVERYMHLAESYESSGAAPTDWDGALKVAAPSSARASEYRGTYEEDKELLSIFEREFGPIKRRLPEENGPKIYRPATGKTAEDYKAARTAGKEKKQYLLVDGYNIIHAWRELSDLAESDLGAARGRLLDLMCNYQGYTGVELIVVFDAYQVKGNPGSAERYQNIFVIYTKEAETADMYIERTTREIGRKHRVTVATSDALEQTIVLGEGAVRISAREFEEEVRRVSREGLMR